MATQRYISTSFWTDKWIRSLDPSERYLYMYLLTNPMTNIAGVYQITLDRIAFDTGHDERTLVPMLKRFADSGKVFFFDDEYIVIPAWPKHQNYESKAKIKEGIISILQEIPDRVFAALHDFGYEFDIESVKGTYISSKQRVHVSGGTSKRVKEKSGGKCAKCGATEKIHIHHIKPLKEGGDNSEDNLVALCESCHVAIHASPDTLSGLETKTNPVQISYLDSNANDFQSRYPTNYSHSDLHSDSYLHSHTHIDSPAAKVEEPARAPIVPEPPKARIETDDVGAPHFACVLYWYKRLAKATATTVQPDERDNIAGRDLLAGLGGDTVLFNRLTDYFFDKWRDVWFAHEKDGRASFAFRRFTANAKELIPRIKPVQSAEPKSWSTAAPEKDEPLATPEQMAKLNSLLAGGFKRASNG